MKTARGTSLLESLVVAAVLPIMAAILVPTTQEAQDEAKRMSCMRHLQRLCVGMLSYHEENNRIWPMQFDKREKNDGKIRLFNKRYRKEKPKATDIPSPTADLWMLVRSRQLKSDQFICPLTKDTPDPARDVGKVHDFASSKHLSYGYLYQYGPFLKFREIREGSGIRDPMPLLADGNPYIKGGVKTDPLDDRNSPFKGNSLNHGKNRPGQNIVFMDGLVLYVESPDVSIGPSRKGTMHPDLKDASGNDNYYTVHDGDMVDPGLAPTKTKCKTKTREDVCLIP